MKTAKTWWMPVVLGMLLMAVLVGVAGARPNERPLAAGWKKITIPMSACVAEMRSTDWNLYGNRIECLSGYCRFYCPVTFPTAGSVTVQQLTMYAYDYNATSLDDAQVQLLKMNPKTLGQVAMAYVTTTGASEQDPQKVKNNIITGNPIRPGQAPFLWVSVPTSNVWIYGVRIYYTQ